MAATFIAVLIVLELAGHLMAQQGLWDWAAFATAESTAALANLTGLPATASANNVYLDRTVLVMSVECTALYLVLAYAALILVSRAPWRSKLAGLALGTATLLVFNQLRLVLVAWASYLPEKTFLLLHDYLFQVGMLVLVLVVWDRWLARVRRHES